VTLPPFKCPAEPWHIILRMREVHTVSIHIVTDSTCDLPQATIARYGITVLPLHIHFGQQSMLDGIEITRAEFYERLPAANPMPTTAAPGTEVFERAYEELERAGATHILSIHISATLSAVTDVARTAAREYQGVPVTVIDSQQLSMGLGFVVVAAAEAAAEALPLQEVLARVEVRIERTHVFAALDTLEYLRRSGRMNGVVAGLGSLLQIKPLLHMTGGKAGAERVRTSAQAMARLVAILQQVGPVEQAVLLHAHAPERAEQLRVQARPWLPAEPPPTVEITPVLGAHLGLGTVGLAVVSAAKPARGG
jgi:DegV family protein with EDD domain